MEGDAPGAKRFRDLKKEVDEGFDEALAEVTAALVAVPEAVAVPLPGFEPASPDHSDYPPPVPDIVGKPETSPLQEQLDLSSVNDGESFDDPITAFAPSSRINWGPSRPTLKRLGQDDEGSSAAG